MSSADFRFVAFFTVNQLPLRAGHDAAAVEATVVAEDRLGDAEFLEVLDLGASGLDGRSVVGNCDAHLYKIRSLPGVSVARRAGRPATP